MPEGGEALGPDGNDAGEGAVRAAAVLLGLGPEAATGVFRLLGEADIRAVARGVRRLRSSPTHTVAESLRAFVTLLERPVPDASVADDELREIAARAVGDETARRAFDGVAAPPPPDEVLGAVVHADPEVLAMVLSHEQPQTVALVLSALGPERAVSVLERLPETQRPAVVRRMATVESVSPDVLREVGQALAAELRAVLAGGMRRVDGRGAAVGLLRRSPGPQQAEVVEQVERDDPALAEELRRRLFTFDDLSALADRDVQVLVKEVDSGQLALALKGAGPAMRERFLRNMSSRAGEMLGEEMEALGPVRVADVERAQAELVSAALALADKGRIALVRPADRMV